MDLPDIISSRREIKLRPVAEREAAIIEYRQILIAVLREIRAEVNRSIIPAYRVERDYQIDSASWFQSLKAIAAQAIRLALNKFTALFNRESSSHAKSIKRAIKAGASVDVPTSVIIGSRKEAAIARTYIERNTSLITSLSDDMIKRVEQAVYDAKLNNRSVSDLSKTLQKQFGIAKRRADLIAVDQIASINADLNEVRYRELGINEYVWTSRRDERVRPLHIKLDGTRYKYGEKTGAENGLPPGKPINCRCVASPVIPSRDK